MKCTELFAYGLAEKARDATLNIIRLFGSTQSVNAIPLLSFGEARRHRFDFHLHSDNINKFTKSTRYSFAIEHSRSKEFWSNFLIGKELAGNIINLSMKIPEMILSKSTPKTRVIERLERALMWYGEAVIERDIQQKIQKLVISIEAIVNFKDGNITDTFCKRVSNLNITHLGVDNAIGKQALELYTARSNIIHGSSTTENVSFNVVEFCGKTLIRAIYYFSLFGFDEVDYNRKLSRFLDDLPKNALL